MSIRKGILLYSGGLDSLLAAKILLDQGIELIGLNFVLPFVPPDYNLNELKPAIYAESIGLPLRYFRCEHEYMEMVKDPPHGHGKNMNPCIDCKIYFLRKAREIMEEEDASFVATGEVVGQRPMSQMKHMLNHIEKECGLGGNLLRPLSAKILKPTKAETDGIVDREALFAINGRSRNAQMELANKFNIEDYSSPAGGCLLTDKNIAGRVRDLLEKHPNYNMIDVYLLTIGRHYRLHDNAKVIVSRNENESIVLEKYRDSSDGFILPEFKGPSIYVKGTLCDDDYELLSSIIRRYGKCDNDDEKIVLEKSDSSTIAIPVIKAISDNILDKLRI